MREIPEIGHEASTLIAVGMGAVLATIGGFLATILEARLHTRQRERTAALTFGEILASLRVMMRAIEDAHGRGAPFGPLTMRLLKGARREVDAYERSRPALSDLRDTDLRLSVHALMTRLALGVDGVLDAATDPEREGGYGYLLELAPGLDALVARLVPAAGQPISPYQALSHAPGAPPPPETAAPKARTRAPRPLA
jgi:hypothetical protein